MYSINSVRFVKCILVMALVFSSFVNAEFIQMPNTTEAPKLERNSMLKDIDIPGVKDRDPDPKAGPRLNVTEFRIQGLVEYPEIGVTREAIVKQVEAIRFDMMGEGKQLSSGYTTDELSEVSNLIADIEKEKELEHVGPLEVQRLVFLIREQRRQRGITVGMIETVADTITRYYREHGFILAKAYIPKQQVRDGIVTLTILLGELGEVSVQNNKHYASKRIENIFKDALAKPITNDVIEEKLFFVNDLPGVTAQGYFEAGSQVGDSKLNVNVVSEKWYDANLRLDNHGSDRSGKNRAYADFSFNNPTGFGDQLQLAVLESFSPANSTYGSLRYNANLFSPRFKFSVGGSSNAFTLGAGNSESTKIADSLDIEGKSVVADASIKYQWQRSRVKNYDLGLKVTSIDSEITIDGQSSDEFKDTVQNIELFSDFDFLNEKSRTLHQGNLSLISSHFVKGADENQPKSPFIASFDYSMLTFVKLPLFKVDSRLVLKASGQYSGSALASVNQFSLGGPTRARGYDISEFSADDAVYLGADLIFKGPNFKNTKIGGERLDNILQPFVFVDFAYGRSVPLIQGEEDTTTQLPDIGVGLKFSFKSNLHGDLTLAQPVGASSNSLKEDTAPGNGLSVYFDIQYAF